MLGLSLKTFLDITHSVKEKQKREKRESYNHENYQSSSNFVYIIGVH